MKTVKAKFYPANSSLERNVNLRVEDEKLILSEGDELWSYNLQTDLNVEAPIANLPQNIFCSDGSKIICCDRNFNRSLDRNKSFLKTWLPKLESNLQLVVAGSIIFILSLIVAYKFGLPLLSKSLAPMIPKNFMNELGESSEDILVENFFQDRSEVDRKDLVKIAKLKKDIEKNLLINELEFIVLKSPKIGPNALALPHHTVILSDEIVSLLGASDELLAVLYHELGHIVLLHAQQDLIRNSLLGAVLFALLGPTDLSALTSFFVLSAYSRQAEAEADYFAAYHLHKLGKDPELLSTALKKISQVKSDASSSQNIILKALSSHPLTEDRKEQIKAWKEEFSRGEAQPPGR